MMSDTTMTQWNGAQLQKPGPCQLSASAEGIVSVTVTTVPEGSQARVDYAVAQSAPAREGGEWTFLGKTGADGTLRTPALPAGATVWVRLRSEAPGGFSEWADPDSVRTPATARLRDVRIALDGGQPPVVTWERNGFTGGVRIRYATHGPNEAPGEMGRLDESADAARKALPLQVQPGEALTVEVRPWTGWDGESVLGDAGVPIRRSRGIAADASTYALINCREVERTPESVLYRWVRGPAVEEVWVYDLLHPQPVPSDPWPGPEDVHRAIVLSGEDEYRAEIPPQGYVRYLQFEPRTESLAPGAVQRFHLLPAGAGVSATALLKPVVSGATAALTLTVQGPEAAFPVTAEIMEDDPDGASLVPTHTFTAPGAIGPEQYPALAARELPLRELRRWYARVADADGNVTSAFAAADRDALPGGVVTPRDQQSRPTLVCLYDDDTDRVQITVPGGRTVTHPPLDAEPLGGSGTFTYVVGDRLDDGSTEPRLTVGETRPGYRVRYQGGGTWQTIWDGVLHGDVGAPPVVETRVVLSPDQKKASVYVRVASSARERVRLSVRDSEAADAPVYRLVAGPSDPTPRYVESGVELGPADYFQAGVGAPAQKLADLPLLRDQIRSIFVQAQGEESQAASSWVPVTFGILEKPWLESVDLVWDEDNDLLRLTAQGGAHCRSATFQISADPGFGGPGEEVALGDGERGSAERALGFADRKKVWYGRVTPRNGDLAGEPQQDTAYVPEPPRPQVGAIRQVAGTSSLTTDLTVQVAAARAKAADPKGQGGTLYVWTNRTGNGDADPAAAPDAVVPLADTPVEVTSASTPALHDVLVWPGRGKQVHVKFVAADGGDSGVVTQTLYSWLDLVGSDGKLVPGAVDRPAAFAASMAPFRRVSALPGAGAFDGERVFVVSPTTPPTDPNHRRAFQWSAASSAWTQVDPGVGTYSFLPAVVANSISTEQLAASAVTTDKLNVARVFVSGMTVTSNTPTAGRVVWTACQVVYRGVPYGVAGGSTTAEVVWWRNQAGYSGAFQSCAADQLEASGYDQTRGDAIILLNRSGTAVEVWNGTMIYDGLIATDAIKARHLDVATLSAITADLGTVSAGLLQNAASSPTAAVRLSGTYVIPPTASCYLDLAAVGGAPFLYHPRLQLNRDGSAVFSGTMQIGSNATYDTGYDPFARADQAERNAKSYTDQQVVGLAGSVVMRSATEPLKRPNGSDLKAGDVWIDTRAGKGDAPYTWDPALRWVAAYTKIDGGHITTGTIDASRITIGPATTYEAGYDPAQKETPTGAQDKATQAENSAKGYTDDQIRTSKSQLSTVIRSGIAPTGRPDGTQLRTGDVWIDTSNGDAPNTWTGSDWQRAYTRIDGGNITTGKIKANFLDVERLSALTSDIGHIHAGVIHNGIVAPDGNSTTDFGNAGIALKNLDIPGTWQRYVNLNGSGYFLYASDSTARTFSVDYSGNAFFKGRVEATEGVFSSALIDRTCTIRGVLDAATGTFGGDISIATGDNIPGRNIRWLRSGLSVTDVSGWETVPGEGGSFYANFRVGLYDKDSFHIIQRYGIGPTLCEATLDGSMYAHAYNTFSPSPPQEAAEMRAADWLSWATEDARKPVWGGTGIPHRLHPEIIEQARAKGVSADVVLGEVQQGYGKDISKISIGTARWADEVWKALQQAKSFAEFKQRLGV